VTRSALPLDQNHTADQRDRAARIAFLKSL